jgi:hypothetical protein
VKTTSVQPGVLSRPDGELQVVSEPVTSAHVQGLIDAFNGKNGDKTYTPWPRSTVTLANGEQATLVPSQFDGDGPTRDSFFVIINSTLLQVTGDVALADIQEFAAKLRPLKKAPRRPARLFHSRDPRCFCSSSSRPASCSLSPSPRSFAMHDLGLFSQRRRGPLWRVRDLHSLRTMP